MSFTGRGRQNPNYRGGRKKQCRLCYKRYWVIPCKLETSHYCSRLCQNRFQARESHLEALKRVKINPKRIKKIYLCSKCEGVTTKGRLFCNVCTQKGKRRIIISCKLCSKEINSWVGRIKSFCSQECKYKYYSGKGNPHYIDGRTPINRKIRNSKIYEKWRVKVFERDNYTCQICGQYGGELQVDHIKPFSLFPELRL